MIRQSRFDFLVFLIMWAIVLLILSRQRNSYLDHVSESLQQRQIAQKTPRKSWEKAESVDTPTGNQKPASALQDPANAIQDTQDTSIAVQDTSNTDPNTQDTGIAVQDTDTIDEDPQDTGTAVEDTSNTAPDTQDTGIAYQDTGNTHQDTQDTGIAVQDTGNTIPEVVDLETGRIPDRDLGHPARFRDLFKKMYSWHVDVGLDNVTDHNKYLIYRCDTTSMERCGGWADRLRGFMAGYIIANITGRVFKSEMLIPSCNIQKYIVPNLVNWSLPVSFHKRVNESEDVRKLIYSNDVKFWKEAKNIDFRTLPAMKAKYVYFKSNLDYMDGFKNSTYFQKEMSWMKTLTRDQINAVIFKRLFKLPPQMQSKLDSLLAKNLQPSNRLVCIHIRTGRNPTLPHDTADRVRDEDLPRIWNFLHGIAKNANDKIFMMSDSDNVLNSARNNSYFRDKLFFTSGQIVHLENSKGMPYSKRCDGLEKIVLEQFLLMHCDALVISKSGLSRMSAYVRGSDQDLYCLLEKGQIVPCKNKDVKEFYHIMG